MIDILPSPLAVSPRPGGLPDPALRPRAGFRQLIVGLVALPLSVMPFFAYAGLTPEGRLVRDRAMVALSPPSLPSLSAGRRAAAASAAPSYRDKVMVLAYHGIGSGSGEEGFAISPKRFAEHLATLSAAGMQSVTADQVARSFDGGAPLPAKAVLISFDDGRADAMMFADPLLAQARMRATMFVIAGAASEPGLYYSPWSRIESYARSGRWDIQSHTTASHREHKVPGGRSLPALTSRAAGESITAYRDRVRADLAATSDAIEAHVGRRPVAFAYPFGAYGADRTNDPAIRGVLAAEVARLYTLAFHQDDQDDIPLATADQDPLGLRRLEVGDWSGPKLLDEIAAAARRAAPPDAPSAGVEPSVAAPDAVVPEDDTVATTPSVTIPPGLLAPLPSVPMKPVPLPRVSPRPVLPPLVDDPSALVPGELPPAPGLPPVVPNPAPVVTTVPEAGPPPARLPTPTLAPVTTTTLAPVTTITTTLTPVPCHGSRRAKGSTGCSKEDRS